MSTGDKHAVIRGGAVEVDRRRPARVLSAEERDAILLQLVEGMADLVIRMKNVEGSLAALLEDRRGQGLRLTSVEGEVGRIRDHVLGLRCSKLGPRE